MQLADRLQQVLGAGYTVERELGGGGMARVFLANDVRLGRPIVIKTIAPEVSGSINLERFEREIALAARLQHPQVVPLLATGDVDGVPYYIMPYLEGESLRARLARGDLAEDEAIAILRDVARALDYAHSKGVVHRDIKPDNVLLNAGSAAVADFGVAKALSTSTNRDELTGIGISVGTPAYMAPEQGAGDPSTDQRADIYAFGVMTYETFARKLPFAASSPSQMMAAHALKDPEPLERIRPSVPPAIADLVRRCLAKRPEERPQTARELVQILEGISTSRSPVGSTSRSRGRRMRAVGAVATVLVVALGAIAYARLKPPALNPHRILVTQFDNLTGDSSLSSVGRMAADWLTRGIAAADVADIVTTSALSAATARGTGLAAARDAGLASHAGTVIWGSVYRRRDSLYFDAQVTDLRTGRAVNSVENVSAPVSDPMAGIQVLRERLLSATMASSDGAAVRMIGSTPRSDAYDAFVKGAERFGHLRYDEAIPLLERSIALDATFGAAYTWLAAAHGNSGRYDVADSILRISDRYRASMSVIERRDLDYLRATWNDEKDKALEIAQELSRRDSSTLSLYWVGLSARVLNRPDLALRALGAIPVREVDALGWPPYWGNYTQAYHEKGDYAKELRKAREFEQRFPANLTARVRALSGLGDEAALSALTDSVARSSIDTTGAAGALLMEAGRELRAHGHAAAAMRMFDHALAWYRARPPEEEKQRSGRRREIAALMDERGALDSASARWLAVLAEDTTHAEAIGRVGAIAAHLGQMAEADRRSAQLGSLRLRRGEPMYWRAVIAAAKGDREGAVRYLQEALRAGMYFSTRIHTEKEFQSLRAEPGFREILRPKG
jgi:serine/threonine-protein kinase